MKDTDPDTPQASGRPHGDRQQLPPKVVPTSPDIPDGLDLGPQPPGPADVNRDNDLIRRHQKVMSEAWNRTERPADPGNNDSNQEKDSEGKP